MPSVAALVDSLEDLDTAGKATLKAWVVRPQFGAALDADVNNAFWRALAANIPPNLNAVQKTAVEQAIDNSGKQHNPSLSCCEACLVAGYASGINIYP